MNQVIDWIKSNVVIVVLVVVMIAALVVIPMYASKRNTAVREQVEQRVQRINELRKLDKTAFEDPVTGETKQVAVNEALLEQYQQVIERKRHDGEQIVTQALAFNRDDHSIIEPDGWSAASGAWLFPEPPNRELLQVRPRQFHDLLVDRYEQLLEQIGAGSPPDAESLADELQEKDTQFRLHTLSKTADEALGAEDQRKLTEHLQAYRMQQYEETARSIGIYADLDALNIPQFDPARQPGLAEMFQWQWQYWMIADVLHALADANAEATSVLQAPVKRLLSARSSGAPAAITSSSDGGGMSSGGMASGGMASGGMASGGMASGGTVRGRRPIGGASTSSSDRSGGGGQPAGGPAAPINPNQPVPIDYSVSLTGRTSNHLYDVHYVQLSIIADTERLPVIIDALAKRNFITVLDMSVQPVDPFQQIQQGYMYGDGTVSRADMVLETIWLRQWTSESMPDELKSALGIPVKPRNPPQG